MDEVIRGAEEIRSESRPSITRTTTIDYENERRGEVDLLASMSKAVGSRMASEVLLGGMAVVHISSYT